MIEKRIIEKTLKEIELAESSFQQGLNFCYAARDQLSRLTGLTDRPKGRTIKKNLLVSEAIKSRRECLERKIKKV